MIRQRGFTLVELMVVLVLLGVLATLTTPRLLHFTDRWMLRSTAHMMANDIRRVQSLSVQECDQYQFELHTKRFYYQTKNYQATAAPLKRITLDSRITLITSTLYNPGYSGTLDGYRILRFSYLGSPNQGGSIVMKTQAGNTVTITVEVTTGRVKVHD